MVCDAMMSNIEYEVLINNLLGSELGIVILNLRDKQRFKDEGATRDGLHPQYWF